MNYFYWENIFEIFHPIQYNIFHQFKVLEETFEIIMDRVGKWGRILEKWKSHCLEELRKLNNGDKTLLKNGYIYELMASLDLDRGGTKHQIC